MLVLLRVTVTVILELKLFNFLNHKGNSVEYYNTA